MYLTDLWDGWFAEPEIRQEYNEYWDEHNAQNPSVEAE